MNVSYPAGAAIHPTRPHYTRAPDQNLLARIQWLEQQHQIVFNDAAKQYNHVQQLMQERLDWAIANKNLHSRIQQLEKENVELTKTNERLSRTREDQAQAVLTHHLRIEDLQAENDRLRERHSVAVKPDAPFCGDCNVPAKLEQAICPICFMPAEEGADELEDDYNEQSREWNERNWKSKISQSTRLEAGAFDWLVRWCKSNLTRIEQQRNIHRERSLPEIRKLQQDLREAEDELARCNDQVARVRKRKRQINGKILVLTDDERIDSSLSVKKEVFLFCKVMGYPQYDFWRASNEFVGNERQLVRYVRRWMCGRLHAESHQNVAPNDERDAGVAS